MSCIDNQRRWFNQRLDDLEELIEDYQEICSMTDVLSYREEEIRSARFRKFRKQLMHISDGSSHPFLQHKALSALGVCKDARYYVPLLEDRLYAMYATKKGKVDEYVENPEKHNWHENREVEYKEEDVRWWIESVVPFKMRRIDTLINIEEFYNAGRQQEFYELLRLAYQDNDLKEVRDVAGAILGYSNARIWLNDFLFRFKTRKQRQGEVYTINMLCITKRDDLKPSRRY